MTPGERLYAIFVVIYCMGCLVNMIIGAVIANNPKLNHPVVLGFIINTIAVITVGVYTHSFIK